MTEGLNDRKDLFEAFIVCMRKKWTDFLRTSTCLSILCKVSLVAAGVLATMFIVKINLPEVVLACVTQIPHCNIHALTSTKQHERYV